MAGPLLHDDFAEPRTHSLLCSVVVTVRGRLVAGLDNSGKSTLLHRLSQGQVTALQPTERPHIDEFQLGGISFKVGRGFIRFM